MRPSTSTECLLNSFPMFGHPGISALEYAGQVERMRKQSTSMSESSLKRKSTTSTHEENTTPPSTAGTEPEGGEEMSTPVHFIDEFGCQQRRRGTFINHTPRNFEIRSSKTVEVYRPWRRESENYSRPLSRQGSMASTSPVFTSQHGHIPATNPGTVEKRSTIVRGAVAELDSTEVGLSPSQEAYEPSTKSRRRSFSAPLSKLTYRPSNATLIGEANRGLSLRSTSASDYQPQDTKRQRRQTPFKLPTSKQINALQHAPMEPLIADHRRKGTDDAIGDVPFDMDREASAEFGTFGVIQRYFDSGGDPAASPKAIPQAQSSSPPNVPLPLSPHMSMHKPFMEPIAIYPFDELEMPDGPPPVPDRSPKRLTNPNFPQPTKSDLCRDSDFKFAAEGQYLPYDKNIDVLHVSKRRIQKRLSVGQAAWVGSPNVGKLAPPILGHDALTASSKLRLNDLSYYLKHTGPSPEPQLLPTQQKKKGMRLFKVKQRKSLAARVGSVESSPQRARNRPLVPACAREMTTSAGARHLKIIIPNETPSGCQAVTLPVSKQRTQRRSRHISISFTEEMLNPLASADVERMISGFETPECRSSSTPASRSPRSPKRFPKAPKPVPVGDHPLASRDEQTRARKLRDLQRIKRKPVPVRTPSEQQLQDATAGALPSPAQTPEPVTISAHEGAGIAEESPSDKMGQLQGRVLLLQRQNTQLTEALAKIVGLELKEGDLKSEDVLEAFQRIRVSRTSSLE